MTIYDPNLITIHAGALDNSLKLKHDNLLVLEEIITGLESAGFTRD